MITISAHIVGTLSSIIPRITDHALVVIDAHCTDIANSIRQSYEESKSGRLSTRNDGSVYQSSAAGEAPAIKERELYASIQVVTVDDLTRAIITDDPKAPYLEYGTDRIAPRPSFAPAADASVAAFVADMAALERALA